MTPETHLEQQGTEISVLKSSCHLRLCLVGTAGRHGPMGVYTDRFIITDVIKKRRHSGGRLAGQNDITS
jgi:hypothetical protein